MFPRIGLPEIAIVFLIIILLFGVGRISKIGSELGSGIRAFRDSLRGDDDLDQNDDNKPTQ
ncbi:MAG: twin-arginine translocase TatA/TatE family subunit [Chloroflexi bacterium]|jgi:sec-independent protein translocase protein TatA|nr:twin-arginine translocase TatA/TatE family subunit [Anaerolineaceae bacterium]NMB88396.1 twin-arginine translocase TatA/TatE family subunit [Chloroflexota bacterium]